jgi:hypothetical protein
MLQKAVAQGLAVAAVAEERPKYKEGASDKLIAESQDKRQKSKKSNEDENTHVQKQSEKGKHEREDSKKASKDKAVRDDKQEV